MKTTNFIEKKNERIQGYSKKSAHKRKELPLQEGSPTMQSSSYRAVTKSLSPLRNMKTLETNPYTSVVFSSYDGSSELLH